MSTTVLGARHLSDATSVGELQRVNNFYVSIAMDSSEQIGFLVQSFELPKMENEVITVGYGNSVIKIPGPVTYNSGSLVIRDSINYDTELLVYSWRKEVYDPKSEAIGFASDYKKQATLYEYSPDGSTERIWKLEGVWPSAFEPGELDNEGSSIKTMTLTLEYDRAYRVEDTDVVSSKG